MFRIRSSTKNDVSFVYATWLKSYKYDSPLTKFTKSELFYNQHQKILDRLLLKAKVNVACDQNDEDLIFGYIVFEPHVIHYIYVKEPFRGYGIATKLLEAIEGSYQASHLTYSLLDLWSAKKINCEFNPYLLIL